MLTKKTIKFEKFRKIVKFLLKLEKFQKFLKLGMKINAQMYFKYSLTIIVNEIYK